MNRKALLNRIVSEKQPWDVIVIGGGATGLGVALDSVSRGYRTVLLEQHDFAKATSSRSTKIAHGGVRYMQQADFALVYEALHERGRMIQNAPHLVYPLKYIIPTAHYWELPFFGIGLKFYDALSGRSSLGPSLILSKKQTLEHLPTLNPDKLVGGILYMDGQFDDARLALTLALTTADLGGVPLNYCPVDSLLKTDGRVDGVAAHDAFTGEKFELRAKIVINATGIFTDFIRRMDEPHAEQMLSVSQGTHIVVDGSFLPSTTALMIPKTDDGRLLFGIPWYGKLVIGTTDIPMKDIPIEPKPLKEEIDFLVKHSSRYLTRPIRHEDILSVFAGLRPLVRAKGASTTSKLSRTHRIEVSDAKLLTITGGKWTTYRRMAQDTMDEAIKVAGLAHKPTGTKDLPLHGAMETPDRSPNSVYGSDIAKIEKLGDQEPGLNEKIHPNLPYTYAECLWSIREEMGATLEDVLSRRTRSLLLDARASMEAAPKVARLIARELGHDSKWEQEQVAEYLELAKSYLPA
ncbi:MAG: FAD-dependent oxidoreductase [Verrucomicrobia bacterium Tous-C9LFEB]|nr:MAG: FAD-dependent oxidoreductase [Verrucomicrobia bacterium Tous-C9LFEB]